MYDCVIIQKTYKTQLLQGFQRFLAQKMHLKSTVGKERKSALLLLSEIVGDGNEAMCDEALEMADECGALDSDNIRQCYLLISKPENHPRPLQFTTNPPKHNYNPDLSVYDNLTGGAAV